MIDKLKPLREQIDAMLARKQVIESLQGTRAETVHLFNELAQRLPDGVYLKSVKQTGRQVSAASRNKLRILEIPLSPMGSQRYSVCTLTRVMLILPVFHAKRPLVG